MKSRLGTRNIVGALIGAGISCGLFANAHAAEFGGVEFPQGAISFADHVVDYSPVMVGTGPTEPHRGSFNALGPPDYSGDNSCASQAACSFVSLGDGGSITLKFTDNLLTGSGSASLDLWIFEVGPDVEDTYVDISKDGAIWYSVGKVGGATAGVDIDSFGYGISDQFAYVRLTDDPLADADSGSTVGADIDAVGAISTVAAIPEPEIYAMMGVGLGLMGWAARRRKQQAA